MSNARVLSKVGNSPAFSAYQSSAQTLVTGTSTKLQFQTEEFDLTGAFDNTTNYRFQPLVAGYYMITGGMGLPGTTGITLIVVLKNGTEIKRGNQLTASAIFEVNIAALVYLNGSTDYVELSGYQASGSSVTLATGANQTYFQGFLARPA